MKPHFIPESQIHNHPATLAWLRLSRSHSMPSSIDFLTRGKGRPLNSKSKIFRLRGPSMPLPSIIAKLGPSKTILTENIVYQEVLPLIGLPQLESFGTINENSETSWLFLEEAPGTPYEEQDPAQHRLAAKTLAEIHTTTSKLDLSKLLPKHNLDGYDTCIIDGRNTISENISNPALTKPHRNVLNDILDHFDTIEAHWNELNIALKEMPLCLVHGDFVGKNVHIHSHNNRQSMYLFDWDISGWGAPAFDIERISPEQYYSFSKSSWPSITQSQIQFMATVGAILRNVGLIQATSVSLCYEWVEKAMLEITEYELSLKTALRSFLKH